MEPTTDRVRRLLGYLLATVLFGGFLAGVGLFGRYVGDVVGEGVVGPGKSREEMITATPVMDPSGRIVAPPPLQSQPVPQQPALKKAAGKGTPIGVAASTRQP